ncbi:MAG: carboxypeptidase regulatory-like domain-containing protein [Deltaproteobacteria bacterium]|nr:carboxypeptidase regulatory-like domain-containing protein [Deltaproteobacteria bacterium]
MRTRIGVVVGCAVLAAAVFVWRCRGGDGSSDDGASTTGSAAPVAKTGKAGDRGVASVARPDPKTIARASISGTVTDDETKAPLAGARVCADGNSTDLAAELLRDSTCATTDAAGAYKLDNLLPAKYVVSATAKTYQPGAHRPAAKNRRKPELALAAGETKTGIDIALRPGGVELAGTVLDLTGGAIAQAKVWVGTGGWWNGRDGAIAHTETDDQGRFTLWVKPGNVSVTAAAEGYADNEESARAPGKIEILLTPESTLAGTVVDGATGAPVEGAKVIVGQQDWGWGGSGDDHVFSDAQGKFLARRLTPGRYVATARTDHGYGRTEGSVLVGLGQHVSGVVVKVYPAHRVEGKVLVAGTNAPCEDPSVALRDAPKNRWVGGEHKGDGLVVADAVLPGTYTVQVWCQGFQPRDKYDSVVVADKDVTGLVWEVDTGATIRGKLLTKSGAPVEDASLWAQSIGGAARDKQGWGNNQSERDGSYELTGLKAGSYKIEVQTDKGVPPRDGYRAEVAAGATVEKDLVLDDGGKIAGTVVDETGKPVSGVDVRARATTDSWFSWGGGENKSDDAGNFTLDSVRPGDYRVVAQRGWRDQLRKPGTNDDAKQGEKVTVRAGQTASVRLVVESQTGTITGTVVDTEGHPVSDAFVSAARESDAAGAQKSSVGETRWNWDEKPVITATDGTFTVGKLSPGAYTVRAYRKGGGEAVAEHVAVGGTAKLQIKATGSIEGVARRADGAPVEMTVQVRELTTGFWRREQFYRTDGRFTVRDVPKGHFQITVEAEGSQKMVELDLAEGEARTGVTVELEALIHVTGRVVEHGTQKPVAGIAMMASPATGGGFTFSSGDDDRANISDETGRFTIKHAPRGKLQLRGWPKDWTEDGDFLGVAVVRSVEGSGTVDVGDIGIIKKRVKKGDVVGELGVNFAQQPPETPPDKRELKVSWIDPAGPAAKTELKVGDLVTSIDGIDITGSNSLQSWVLMRAPPSTKLALGLARGATVHVTLAAP